jgi:hypothetical protein
MTTKAGLAGFLTGLTATMILIYPLAIARYSTFTCWTWIAVVAASAITIGGGALAGTWSGSVHPVRCAILGGLAGGLAGTIVFCLLGAGTAGLTGSAPLFDQTTDDMTRQRAQIETITMIVRLTQRTFLVTFLGGIGLGTLGGWLVCPRRDDRTDSFDKSAPQMAMNAAITAVPAAVAAVALTAVVFSRLANSVGENSILDMPLTVSLLLILLSHFALTFILPHEAREAEHVCGMDEVKMAAYVGVITSPVLALLLFLVGAKLFLKPQVIVALLASAVMSLRSLQVLFKLILPGRISFAVSQDDRQKIEATLFGTIADSHGLRLMALCIGCGFVMILPLYVTLLSVLINLTICFAPSTPTEVARKIFLTQALASSGLAMASIVILTAIYLFYLNLGRWFKRRYLHR